MEEPFGTIKYSKMNCIFQQCNYLIQCPSIAYWSMYGLRSVGSRHMHSLPFGFLTTTEEFSHSGTLTFASSSLLRIPCETILSSSCLNWSFSANGTFRGGFCTGIALHAILIYTGSHLNLPIP